MEVPKDIQKLIMSFSRSRTLIELYSDILDAIVKRKIKHESNIFGLPLFTDCCWKCIFCDMDFDEKEWQLLNFTTNSNLIHLYYNLFSFCVKRGFFRHVDYDDISILLKMMANEFIEKHLV